MFKVTAAAGLYVLVQTLSVIAEPHVWMRSSLKVMDTLRQINKKILTNRLMDCPNHFYLRVKTLFYIKLQFEMISIYDFQSI